MAQTVPRRIPQEVNRFYQEDHKTLFLEPINGNLSRLFAVIVGPEQTPYEGGFFPLLIEPTATYPMDPPKVTFRLPVRLHPNLYAAGSEGGKVCLTILGTWGGTEAQKTEGWSPAMHIGTILTTIQAELDECPLSKEPGQQSAKVGNPANQAYALAARALTLKHAVDEMLRKPVLKEGENDGRCLPPTIHRAIHRYYREHPEIYARSREIVKAHAGEKVSYFHGTVQL